MNYVGVYYSQSHRKWQSLANVGGQYHLGYFRDAYGAALARDRFILASGCMRRRRMNNLPERRVVSQPVLIERRQPA